MKTKKLKSVQHAGDDAGKYALIDIELALAVRSMADTLGLSRSKLKGGFLCNECKQPLAPHRHGQLHQGPHFEHYRGNDKNCK